MFRTFIFSRNVVNELNSRFVPSCGRRLHAGVVHENAAATSRAVLASRTLERRNGPGRAAVLNAVWSRRQPLAAAGAALSLLMVLRL